MADSYILTFNWPHTDARSVIVTGTFDNWSSSVHLQKSDSGFTGSVAVPWDSKILYKFVVDENWVTHPSQPTETDASGFVNNVVHTPARPSPPPPEPEVAASEEVKKEVIDETQPEEKKEVPVEVAPEVPVPIQPVVDASTDNSHDLKPVAPEIEASTHQPVAPSTPPQKKSELPVQGSAPVTPIKTNGLTPTPGHARTSTTSTAPSSSAPSTPKTQNTFPTTESGGSETGGSPGSKYGSLGRQKRQSIFGKIRARLSGSPDKKEKRRLASQGSRSGSPTPASNH